jgi:hypothetical protein
MYLNLNYYTILFISINKVNHNMISTDLTSERNCYNCSILQFVLLLKFSIVTIPAS